jgi:preprotein translocase subunit SecD
MNRRIRTRLLISLLLAALSIYLFAGFPPSLTNMKERIKLGLDLSGGIHLVLEVVTDDALRAETDHAVESIRTQLQKENIPVRLLTRTAPDRFAVQLANTAAAAELRSAVEETLPDWQLQLPSQGAAETYTVALSSNRVLALRSEALDQTINTIRKRVDQLGVTEPVIQKRGGAGRYEILLQLPGFDDEDRVKNLIGKTAILELKLVQGGPFPNEAAAHSSYGGTIPGALELLPSIEDENATSYYLVQREASVTGRDLKTAFVSRDENSRPAVGFNLAREGAQRFARVTEQNVGRRLAIVLDGTIQSAPIIEGRIADTGTIEGGTGGFSSDEARDLSLILRSGALPASIKYLEQGKVSATLGADSIRAGALAAALAMVAVIVFVLFYYRLAGVNATLAMLLNLLLLLGAVAYFGVTLTLPGIAGFSLTIGLGIDSNVLIFERIREELRTGKTPVAAVSAGFNRVFITLIDTHLAAVISAAFLFLFGTGAIQGFAVTLVIGLVANLFTAVFVSRALFEWLLARHCGAPLLARSVGLLKNGTSYQPAMADRCPFFSQPL